MERAIQAGNLHLFRNAGLLLGIGLGGFFDGIVLHQLLQWHHMVSSVSFFAPTTLPGLRTNTFADGLFHAVTYLATIAGIALLWRAVRSGQSGSARQLIGLVLAGWGIFNLVEGVIDHLALGVHHVNETAPRAQWLWWDLGFLLWGAAMLAIGWWLWRGEPARISGASPSAAR